MTARTDVPRVSDKDEQFLGSIAQSVRGTFKTVEDMTQAYIREAITQGIFRPGQRLNLDSIAQTLGVSRMPVRASLRQLETEGLVQINHYRGAVVSVLTPAEIAEIYELRILLESHLLRLAIEALDDEKVDRLAAIVEELENAEEVGERRERHNQLYEELYRQADRPLTLAQVNNLWAAVSRYLLLRRVDEQHSNEAMIAHLRARDADAAVQWLVNHLETVSAKLQDIVARDDEATPA